jgi:hypothetical protein
LAGGTVESDLDLSPVHALGVVDLQRIDAIHCDTRVEKEIAALDEANVGVTVFELRALLSAQRAAALSFACAKRTFCLDVLGCDR